jgi:branched-chain amino acid transport system substrate-binding protein
MNQMNNGEKLMNKGSKIVRLFLTVALFLLAAGVYAQDATPEMTPDGEMGEHLIGAWEACADPVNLSGAVTIGAIFSLSGGASVYGVVQQQAVELARQEINDAGYLGEGATLEVIFEDSAGDPEQAINAMTKLVEEDGVVAVIGPTLSTEAFAADPVAQDAGTVVLGVSNTAIGITDMGDFVFRNSLPEAAVIPGVVTQATEVLGITTAGVLYANDDDFTISGYEVFLGALEENGVEVLGEETFATGDVDFNSQLTNLIAQNPDALAVSALAAEASQIITQARAQGFTGPIIGGNGFNSPAVLERAGADAEGLIVGAAWNVTAEDQSPSSEAFIAAYEEAYDSSPDQFAAQAYTGAWLMATALRCADSTDHAAVRDALAGITDFDSPLGVFSFDENRDPVHDPVAQIVEGGVFTVLSSGSDEEMSATDEMMATEEMSATEEMATEEADS